MQTPEVEEVGTGATELGLHGPEDNVVPKVGVVDGIPGLVCIGVVTRGSVPGPLDEAEGLTEV